jgi:hypothetical protein
MKIAQFRDTANSVVKILAEDDICATLPMYTRTSEWVEVDFPQLPPADYLPKQLQSLDREEQELREKLSRVSQARARLQPDQPGSQA